MMLVRLRCPCWMWWERAVEGLKDGRGMPDPGPGDRAGEVEALVRRGSLMRALRPGLAVMALTRMLAVAATTVLGDPAGETAGEARGVAKSSTPSRAVGRRALLRLGSVLAFWPPSSSGRGRHASLEIGL